MWVMMIDIYISSRNTIYGMDHVSYYSNAEARKKVD